MAFREKKLGDFLDAKVQAAELLQGSGVIKRGYIGFEEAIIMQVSAELSDEQPEGFYGYQIMREADMKSARVYQSLRRFEDEYAIVTSSLIAPEAGPPKRNYLSTEFGKRVFDLFL